MRLSSLCFLLLVFPTLVSADENTGAKESVRFDGQTLVLAATGTNPGESVREFIPAGENLKSWTKLASIRKYPQLDDPRAVAENLVRSLKKQYPGAQSALIQNPKSGEVIVDFVVWPPDNAFVEFNIFKYSKAANGGLIAQQYAMRGYGDAGSALLQGLKPVRQRLLEQMAKKGLEIGL